MVSLLLAPDMQRSSHPSVDLEPERRPLAELAASGTMDLAQLQLRPGSFLVWT
jgi:3,4-dihydroxy 2-butanone 4-phosphate synthase/GTP cyclohydrolase II